MNIIALKKSYGLASRKKAIISVISVYNNISWLKPPQNIFNSKGQTMNSGRFTPNSKLEQLERLHFENTSHHPMITHTIDSYSSQSYKFKPVL